MSQFYGTLQGSSGEATRQGTKSSGIRASVQSHGGSLVTEMYGINKPHVRLRVVEGSSSHGGDTMYTGPLANLRDAILMEGEAEFLKSVLERFESMAPEEDLWMLAKMQEKMETVLLTLSSNNVVSNA